MNSCVASEFASWNGACWIWPETSGRQQNSHVLFRKSFSLKPRARHAVCRISANTFYELYVNGRWVGRGPVRSDPAWQHVDTYDVTAYLAEGDNVVAVHAYHHGEDHVGVLTTYAGPGGLLAQIEIELADSQHASIGTDVSWRVIRAPQYATDTGFITRDREDYKETCDARLELVGWQKNEYNDRSWRSAVVLGTVPCPPWTQLIANPLPAMTHETVFPLNVFTHHSGGAYGFCKHDVVAPEAMRCDDDAVTVISPVEPDFEVQILFDFGKAMVGRFHLDIADATGGEVFISYGDSLDLTRIDHLLLRPGAQSYQPYERRFGRYVMLTLRNLSGPVSIRRAWFELVTYPVEPRGAFECSDPMLNRIWEVGRWTLRMNMHDHYEDCPFREQMLYCGDVRVASLLAYYTFGDYALARESLLKLARIQRDNGSIPNWGYIADKWPTVIPEYPALWLITLHDYWLHSGDALLVVELWPNVKKLLTWYAQWHDETGLMRQLPNDLRADFVDNLSGIPMDGPVLAVQCFYYLALRGAQRMAKVAGDADTARTCDKRATHLAEAINARFWDEKLEGYLSCLSGMGEETEHLTPDVDPKLRQPLSQITNGMALYADVVPDERLKPTLRTLLEPKRASPARSGYMGYYLVEALFRHHQDTDAVRRIREYWGGMIERGATTFWEVFDPSMPEGRVLERLWSLCHEFCAGPLHSLPRHVLGVEPLEAGFRRTRLAPVLGSLQWAKGRVPTPLGAVTVHWQIVNDGLLTLEFSQPAGMEMEVEVPSCKGTLTHLELDGADLCGLLGVQPPRIKLASPATDAVHHLTAHWRP